LNINKEIFRISTQRRASKNKLRRKVEKELTNNIGEQDT